MKRLSTIGKAALRRVPMPLRRLIVELVRGDAAPQAWLRGVVHRAASRSVRTPGHGDTILGGIASPYRAETVATYDSRGDTEQLSADILQAWNDAGIDAVRLPGEWPPLIVVPEPQWQEAWTSLADDKHFAGLWLDGIGRARPLAGAQPPRHSADVAVFRHRATSDGRQVSGPETNVHVQAWSVQEEPGRPRPDGGTYAVGTMFPPPGTRNDYAAYLSPGALPETKHHPRTDRFLEPIDLVYTWVDGDDPDWLSRRREWEGASASVDAQITARFKSRDELKYSLRSVESYASWINHIFVVTDGQRPAWLSTAHPRLTLVDHRDLFTAAELPVFNSHAIEARLHTIPGLKDNFLYLNDDFFFGRTVSPEQFFTPAGQPRFFPSRVQIDPGEPKSEDLSVTVAAKNNRSLLEREFGRTITLKLQHAPYAHTVRALRNLETAFPEVFANNVAARFRSPSDHSILSGLAQRVGEVTGQTVASTISYNYADLSSPDLKLRLDAWVRSKPHDVFCLNDTGPVAEEINTIVENFLNAYYPLPSAFEIDPPRIVE